jgi:hypothetical protein
VGAPRSRAVYYSPAKQYGKYSFALGQIFIEPSVGRERVWIHG